MRHQRRSTRVSWPRRRRTHPAIQRRYQTAHLSMTILFWDIDGTLLTTGKAGVPAWEAAVRETTGKEFQLSTIRVPGLTDYQIAARTFELLGVPTTGDVLKRIVTRYEELLP